MHAVIERYRIDPTRADEAIQRIERAAADAVAGQVGFVEYEVIRAGTGTLLTVLVFETREQAIRMDQLVEEFAIVGADAGLGIAPEWAVEGEVIVHRVNEHPG